MKCTLELKMNQFSYQRRLLWPPDDFLLRVLRRRLWVCDGHGLQAGESALQCLEGEVQEAVLDLAQVVRGEVARVAVVHQEQPAERRVR